MDELNQKEVDEWNEYVKRNGLPIKPIIHEDNHEQEHECKSEQTGKCCGKCKKNTVDK